MGFADTLQKLYKNTARIIRATRNQCVKFNWFQIRGNIVILLAILKIKCKIIFFY